MPVFLVSKHLSKSSENFARSPELWVVASTKTFLSFCKVSIVSGVPVRVFSLPTTEPL
jgi:hypothetical protein